MVKWCHGKNNVLRYTGDGIGGAVNRPTTASERAATRGPEGKGKRKLIDKKILESLP